MNQDWTDKLREKMADYREQPSDRVWEVISRKAGVSDRRSVPVWLWSSCAAAALAAGVFLFFDGSNGSTAGLTADHIGVAAPERRQDFVAEKACEPVTEPGESTECRPSEAADILGAGTIRKTASKAAAGASVGAIAKASDGAADAASGDAVGAAISGNAAETSTTCDDSDDTFVTETSRSEAAAADKKISDTSEGYESEADAWRRYLAENREENGRGHSHLSASIHAGSATGATSGERIRMNGVFGVNPLDRNSTSAGWIDPELDGKGAIVFADNATDIDMEYSHKMPVTFGASVRYDFGKRFGAETGLTWSILTSDVNQDNGSSRSKGEQTLNYIGIPLRLSFDIFSSRYFNLYASAGGMMEKAVRGRLRMDSYRGGQFTGTSCRSVRPKPLEWSATASAGVQFNMLPRLGIFAEPGISHHFVGHSPVRSIYTDRPTNFSIGFGLRWTFSD